MTKRFIIVGLVFGLLIGGLAFFHFVFLPTMIKQAILGSPKPPETISAETVKTEQWARNVKAIGTVSAVNGIYVASKVAGIVKDITFESGSDVQKGDKLIQLDDAAEQADLRNLEASLKNATLELEREKMLASQGISAKKDLDTAQSQFDAFTAQIDRVKTTIADKTISAPWAGRLGIRQVDVGSYIQSGQNLIWLQTLDPVYVDFSVPEINIGQLKTGQSVETTYSAYPGSVFKGTITAIDPKVDETTRTVNVRATLPNPDGKIVAGMFATVSVVISDPEPVVTVAETAITYSLYGDSVYVIVPAPDATGAQNGSGQSASPPAEAALQVERRFVKVGEIRDGRSSVLDGLKVGDQVVTVGQLKLRPGVHVKIDNSVALSKPSQAKVE